MKAFALPTLLTLLFVTSVIIQGVHSSSMTTPTTNTTTPIAPNSMADPPANTTTTIASNSTADPPANTTTPIAPNSTADPPANTTTTIAPNSTADPPANTTTSIAPNSTADPPANTTTSIAPNSTADPPANTTTSIAPNSTADPPANNTTTIAPNSTADPPANTTTPIAPNSTADPPANTTTPIASNSTAAPTANTTTPIASNSTTAPTTTAKGNSPGTVSSVTSSNVTLPKTSNPNPDTTGLCQKDSCHDGSSCVSLNNSHFCLCVDGYYYQSSTCNKGKVFPGTIKVNISETSGLENKKSPAYEKLYMEVTKFFEDALKNYDFRQTVIYEVRVSAPARAEVRAGDKLVDVVVVNLLPETTKQNETTISNAINEAISNNPNGFISYARQDRCEFYGCEKTNEQDDCSDGLQCKCKEGLERPNPQTALCLVPKCVDTCNAKHNMQCLVKDSGVPECVCLPGYQKDDRGNCQQCAFGYSGVNCEDQFQLILTIVGTIAGILILGMVIALIFMRSKKNKNLEEQNLIENDFQDLRLQHTTGFSNLGGEGSIFPKVRATAPKDSQMQNPYVQRSMPRPDY